MSPKLRLAPLISYLELELVRRCVASGVDKTWVHSTQISLSRSISYSIIRWGTLRGAGHHPMDIIIIRFPVC